MLAVPVTVAVLFILHPCSPLCIRSQEDPCLYSDAKDDHVYQIDTKCRFYRKTAIAIDRNGDYNDWKCSEEVLAELLLIPVSSKVPKSWPGDKAR